MGDRRILACLLRVWGLMGIRRKNGGHYLVEEIRGKRPIPTRINAVTQFLSRNNAAIPATVNTTRNTQLHKFIFCFSFQICLTIVLFKLATVTPREVTRGC